MASLPPLPLPALRDPAYGDLESPYAVSPLRDICGTRINPDALESYSRRDFMRSAEAPLNAANPLLERWLENVLSFDPRASVTQVPQDLWPLEPVVPRISVWGQSLPFPLEKGTFLVDYRYLASGQGVVRGWANTLKERFGADAKLMLGFFGDPNLNWTIWGQPDFWSQPFLEQFSAIIAPDFAAYGDDPVPESLLGERMVQIFSSEGSKAGHNIVPSIAWRSEDSLRRQIELWTSMYPRVHTIQLDCDGFSVNQTLWWWRWLIALERYCAGTDHIRWLITGRPKGWVIRELNRIFPERNYVVIPSVALYNGCLSSSRGQKWMSETFAKKTGKLETFWTGEEVADKMPRPGPDVDGEEFWPQFRDALIQQPSLDR